MQAESEVAGERLFTFAIIADSHVTEEEASAIGGYDVDTVRLGSARSRRGCGWRCDSGSVACKRFPSGAWARRCDATGQAGQGGGGGRIDDTAFTLQ